MTSPGVKISLELGNVVFSMDVVIIFSWHSQHEHQKDDNDQDQRLTWQRQNCVQGFRPLRVHSPLLLLIASESKSTQDGSCGNDYKR